jgi:predicted RNase H-like nuclease (RuvC/YqgF family)
MQIESSRKLATDLEGKVEELKQQLADQEYERAEIVNRMTSERSKWEVERSGMQSCINQVKCILSSLKFAISSNKSLANPDKIDA